MHVIKILKVWYSKHLIIILSLAVLILLGIGYDNNLFFLHFVDEEYNFTMAKFLLGGQVIYQDTFSNHQPLAFLLSALIQKISTPDSIFLLVKRHREFMIAYSALWAFYLIFRFRLPALIFTLIYEPLKYFYFGLLFLPESLVVYPLIYLILAINIKEQERNHFFTGLALGFIIFLLAPLWPLCFLLLILTMYKSKVKKKILFLGIALIFAVSFYFTDFVGYLNQAIFINYKYFIPLTSTQPTWELILKAFFSPLVVLTSFGDARLWMLKGLSLLFLINLVFLVKTKNYLQVVLSVCILFLSDLRFVDPAKEFFEGFHQLPWISVIILLSIIMVLVNIKNFKKLQIPLFAYLIFLIIFSWVIAGPSLFGKRNQTEDLDIYYSNQFTIGEAIRIMASNSRQDSLFVSPDEWLIYWQSGLHPPRMVNSYYNWMDFVPSLSQDLDLTFTAKPPDYLYCSCSTGAITKYQNNYNRLKRDGNFTNLYVLPEKLQVLSEDQKNKLRFFKFEI